MIKVIRYKLLAFSLSFLATVLCSDWGWSQAPYHLFIEYKDKDSAELKEKLALKSIFQNKKQCVEYIQRLPGLLQAKGYLSASVDSSTEGPTDAAIVLFAGEAYNAARIRLRQKDANYLKAIGWKHKGPENESINFLQYRRLQEKLLDYLENNGYPFAKLALDSVEINEKEIRASIVIDRGIPYKIDSIRVYGKAKISRNFLYHHFNIEKGSTYRKEKLDNINKRLLELPYLEQLQPWDLTMLSSGSIVNLYLQPRKSNQVDVLAGFLPANTQTGGKLLFTVDANLQLKNAFGAGESIGLVWQQLQPKSPRLNIQFRQPYLLNSPFGVDFLFELYKKDSAYLNILSQIGFLYSLSANQTGKLVVRNERTNLLDLDTNRVKTLKTLPDIADVNSINIGADYEYLKTDYRFNPRKGTELRIYAAVGNKKIRENSSVTQIKDPSFDYTSLYDSIKLNTYQFRLNIEAAHYFKLGTHSVFKTGLNSGWYESANYFRNELFQIGGYKLLRGFDEQGIIASSYGVATAEYRYLLGLNSFFFSFIDFGLSKDESKSALPPRTYIGAGLGLAFETKGGIFNISFAAGKRDDLDFNIRQSKIHFGYVSIF